MANYSVSKMKNDYHCRNNGQINPRPTFEDFNIVFVLVRYIQL